MPKLFQIGSKGNPGRPGDVPKGEPTRISAPRLLSNPRPDQFLQAMENAKQGECQKDGAWPEIQRVGHVITSGHVGEFPPQQECSDNEGRKRICGDPDIGKAIRIGCCKRQPDAYRAGHVERGHKKLHDAEQFKKRCLHAVA